MSEQHGKRDPRPMETIYVVSHHTEHGKRHYPIAAYRREVDAINQRNAIGDHKGSLVVDKVTLDGPVSNDVRTGRQAYLPSKKARSDGDEDE